MRAAVAEAIRRLSRGAWVRDGATERRRYQRQDEADDSDFDELGMYPWGRHALDHEEE
jgi:hypothetical protein